VARAALDYLQHPEKLKIQHDRLLRLIKDLDRPGASMNVAKMALEMMGEEGSPQRRRERGEEKRKKEL
jgi:hypothetical protein